MSGAVYRLRRLISTKGSTFLVGAVSHSGVFAFCSHADARNYLSESALSSANTPLYAIMVRDDDTTIPSDTISWGSLSLAIHGIVPRVLYGATLFKVIFAS